MRSINAQEVIKSCLVQDMRRWEIPELRERRVASPKPQIEVYSVPATAPLRGEVRHKKSRLSMPIYYPDRPFAEEAKIRKELKNDQLPAYLSANNYETLGDILFWKARRGNTKDVEQLYREATAAYRKALQLRQSSDPISELRNKLPIYPKLVGILRWQQQSSEALTQAREWVRVAEQVKANVEKQSRSEAYRTLGQILAEQGQLSEAVIAFRRSFQLTELEKQIYFLSEFKEILEFYEKDAEIQFKNWLKISPNDTVIHRALGDRFLELGKLNDAIEIYQQGASRQSLLTPYFLISAGDLLLIQGKNDGASQSYRRAIADYNSGELASYGVLYFSELYGYRDTERYLNRLNPIQLEQFYRLLIQQVPQSPFAYERLIWLLTKDSKWSYGFSSKNADELLTLQKQLEAAISIYQQWITAKPQSLSNNHNFSRDPDNYLARLLRDKSYIQAARKDQDGLVQTYSAILKLIPGDRLSSDSLAELFLVRGNLADGIKLYQTRVKDSSNDADGFFLLGQALTCKGDIDGAISAYYQALKGESRLKPARHLLSRLLAKQGKNQQAAEVVKEILQPVNQPTDFWRRYQDLIKDKQWEAAILFYEQQVSRQPQLLQADYSSSKQLPGDNF